VSARLVWGVVSLLVCFACIAAQGALALRRPPGAHRASQLQHLRSDSCGTLACLACVVVMQKHAAHAPATVAAVAALAYACAMVAIACTAILLLPHDFCPAAHGTAACADVAFVSLVCPLVTAFALASGLPPRLLFGAGLARSAGLAAVLFAAVARHDAGGLRPIWALRWTAKSAALDALLPLLLRAALRGEEPPELAPLQLCPAALRPLRDELLRGGAALRDDAQSLAHAVVGAAFAYTAGVFGQALLGLGGGSGAAPLVLALWALLAGGTALRNVQLHTRRAARAHLVKKRRVHRLHVQLARAEDADPDALLAVAADFLLDALPAGCSVALAEWAAPEPPPPASEPRPLRVLRTAARSPAGAAAAPALAAAARRGAAPGGSARAALDDADSCGGFALASEDAARGAATYADWAALVDRSPAGLGAGALSTSLLGYGIDVVGCLLVHTPPGCAQPAPRLLHEASESVGAALLRSRATHALLAARCAAAAARARTEADATLALQRAFLSGVTHELRTPLNAVVGFTTLVLELAPELDAQLREHLRCSLTAAQTLLCVVNQLLEFAKYEHMAQLQQRPGAQQQAPQQLLSPEEAAAPLRLRTVLDELVDVTGGKAAAGGVALCAEVDAALQAARLRGAAPLLRQVLINLVGARHVSSTG
jgi:hypothetical protein